MKSRVSELLEENRRLREANRRLQVGPAALERDKLIVALRAEIDALRERVRVGGMGEEER